MRFIATSVSVFLALAATMAGCGTNEDSSVSNAAGGTGGSSGQGGSSGSGGWSGGPGGGFGGSSGTACTHPKDCEATQTCASSGKCVPTSSLCPSGCGADMVCSAVGVCIQQGACKHPYDCSEGFNCNEASGRCEPGLGCGAEEFDILAVPPNVLLVLDRTGSMDGEVPNSGGKDRWTVAKEAIASMTANFDGAIRFGLDVFSACQQDGCAPGTIVAPIGTPVAQINQTIENTSLCNSGHPETVIGATLAALVGESSLQDPGRDNVVLLITDGQDNCGGGGAQAAAQLLAQTIPVKTYVIGFSGDVDAAELTGIATAAGTAPYYQADEPSTLEAALQTIAANVTTCTFQLQGPPPDEQMYVFFNDDPAGIPQDPAQGYTYDPATHSIVFHGDACEAIKNGTVTDIDVVFGCDAPSPK